MKRVQTGVFGILACALTMSLSAQSQPPAGGSPQTPSPSASASSSDSKVTVTGCLAKASGSPSPTGTSGAAAGGAASSAKFVLNDVTASPAAAGPAGTSGAAGSIASTYSLDGDDSKLTPHVGHKVEITGSVDKKPMGGDREPGAPGAASSSAGPAKLKVDNVKMIAASCTP